MGIEFALFVGLFSSLSASLLVLLILYYLKPKIAICPVIAKYDDFDGNKAYHIKIINKSLFKALDVRVELSIMSEYNVPKGTNIRLKKITLKKDFLWYIDGRYFSKNASYACMFRTNEDLDEIWKSNTQSLYVYIIAKHSLSGFSKVFVKTYYTKGTSIESGRFEYGNSFKIC